MRAQFTGFYPPTPKELEQLWGNATIVLDTNALLNLYRYSAESRNKLLTVLRSIRPRVWIPHQVAAEFHKNRLPLINTQKKIVDDMCDALDKILADAQGKMGLYSKNPFCDVARIQRQFGKQISTMKSEVKRQYSRAIEKYDVKPQHDPILLEVASLYECRVGPEYDEEKLQGLYSQADARYSADVPPGYKDKQKGSPGKYGDYIAWEQTIEYATANKKDIILVTDELKEDWWWKNQGETLGPRPELRQEFKERTQRLYYQYTPAMFLSEVEKRFNIAISSDVVEEVRETSTERARHERKPIKRSTAYIYNNPPLRDRERNSLRSRKYFIDTAMSDIIRLINSEKERLALLDEAIQTHKYEPEMAAINDGDDTPNAMPMKLNNLYDLYISTVDNLSRLESDRDRMIAEHETLYRLSLEERNSISHDPFSDYHDVADNKKTKAEE